MGKNAQRRRRNKHMARFLRGLAPCTSMKLSGKYRDFQAAHPEVIWNREARRGHGKAARRANASPQGVGNPGVKRA